MEDKTNVPGPAPWPFVGNLPLIDRSKSLQSIGEIGDEYGPIFKLRLGGSDRIFVSGPDLVNEICSRKEFVKVPVGFIKQQKAVSPEGLLTADPGDEHWGIAHRVLVPAFGPLSIRAMFPEMYDIIAQLALKWARLGSDTLIDVGEDFTRLTLDVIALCAMDVRFNSYYSETSHPFADAMTGSFYESQLRSVQPAWLTRMLWKANERFDAYREVLWKQAEDMIAKRRAHPTDRPDLVNAMLYGRDPVTGKGMSETSIRDNMTTFLAAGHETTAGLLSFALAFLLLNPAKYRRLQEEVDAVLGSEPMSADHISRLPYTKACLREALRLQPPVRAIALNNTSDSTVVIGDKWLVPSQAICFILVHSLHTSKEAYGDNAFEYEPERMLEERMKQHPPNVFKAFGTGSRACIGSEFAMQESIMTLAILMQKFNFKLKDPDFKIEIKQAATLRPKDVIVYATPREGVTPVSLQRDLFHVSSMFGSGTSNLNPGEEAEKAAHEDDGAKHPMAIFYGSNTGTCEGLARRLSVLARQRGFECSIEPLNKTTDQVPTDRPVVVISSSHYEGLPPDNASKFVSWLDGLDKSSLEGVNYAVFGCGNLEWKDTYQAIPIRLQESFANKGGHPFASRGETDAGDGNVMGDFDRWQLDHLWPGLLKIYPSDEAKNAAANALPEADLVVPGGGELAAATVKSSSDQIVAKIREVKALTKNEERPKYHLVVDLPEGTTYEVGDYLDVYPRNSDEDIEMLLAILRRHGLDESDAMVWTLSYRHELGQPATQRQLTSIIKSSTPDVAQSLKNLQESLQGLSAVRWPSVSHILAAYPDISISAKDMITLLPPIRPRPYSISSSPLQSPKSCTLTWSLLKRESVGISATDDAYDVPGLASHYLAGLKAGASLKCAVRPGHSRFRPPEDITTPVVMVCAGAGIAPFAGFIVHRAEQVRRNPDLKAKMGRMVLFAGYRSKEHRLHAAEIEASGVVDVRYAYSRGKGVDDFAGYVQDRLWAERQELVGLWDQGAKMYVCGSRAISLACKEVVRRVYRDAAAARCGERTDAQVDEWWIEVLRERYAVDVF